LIARVSAWSRTVSSPAWTAASSYAGPAADAPSFQARETIDCEGRWITPGLIDPHTHLVFGGDRAHEFELRLAGASYEEIARAGGGIVSTMKATRAASQAELVASALPRLDALIAEGLTTIEIKSGYGLSLDDELKCLRAARALADARRVSVTTTFLGAHALPPEYADAPDDYIDHVCFQMIPAVAAPEFGGWGLADAVDAFCEGIGFTPAQTRRVFEAAREHGLPVKLHAEQLSNQNGAALAAAFGALSADHLEHLDAAGIAAMAEAGTTAVLLPGAFYFVRETRAAAHRGPARRRRAAGPGHRLQPRHLAPDQPAADDEHGRHPVPDDRRRMPGRRHARGRAGDRSAGQRRNAGGRQGLRPGRLGRRASRRTCLPHGLQSAPCARLEG
jgi:imidazolonepropionase